MATTRSTGSRRRGGSGGTAPLEDAASGASDAVKRAAAVLEKELAAGVSGFQRLGTQFATERHVDQAAFDEVLGRLRTNAREFVSVAANRVGDLRSEDVQELASQFSTHAQDLLDTVINMVSVAPDLLNRIMASGGQSPTAGAAAATPAPAAKRPARKAAARKAPARKAPARKT